MWKFIRSEGRRIGDVHLYDVVKIEAQKLSIETMEARWGGTKKTEVKLANTRLSSESGYFLHASIPRFSTSAFSPPLPLSAFPHISLFHQKKGNKTKIIKISLASQLSYPIWFRFEAEEWRIQGSQGRRNRSVDSQEADVPVAVAYGRRQDGEQSTIYLKAHVCDLSSQVNSITRLTNLPITLVLLVDVAM
jgi:hypothetical protein